MTDNPSRVKRWQIGLRGIIAYMTMLSPPLIAWSWAMKVRQPAAWRLSVILGFVTFGGALGATVGWLATGKRKGFSVGYVIGGLIGFLALVAITYWLASHL